VRVILLLVVVVAVGLLYQSVPCHSAAFWGVQGHEITAMIGQKYLNANALKQIDSLLANYSGNMYEVASWADQILSQPQWKWSAPLHYINTPAWQCSYDPAQDCGIIVKGKENGMCISAAVTNYSNQLDNSKSSHYVDEVALRFVIHFHGDIHEPLHVGFGVDEGGNTIDGNYFDQPMNLHHVWDTGIIQGRIAHSFGGSLDNYVNYILDQIDGPWLKMSQEWALCNSTSDNVDQTQPLTCPNEWANESAYLACKYAYTDQDGAKIKDGFDLGDDYYQFVKDIVDQQLAKGGIRLASTLNKIWP